MAGADIFISYKSERRKAAEHMAAVLKLYGYSVWFDYELIKGTDFGLQIGRKIRESRALVVLWCSRSVDSRWVVEEAALGDKLGILLPVVIEPCDLPVGFQRQDYIDLSSWDGSPRSRRLDPLIRELAKKTGRPLTLDVGALWTYEDVWDRFGAPPLKAFALGKPVGDVEGDRHMPQDGIFVSPAVTPPSPADHRNEVMALAGREWPAVRDSKDLQRLERFERHFAGTFYAEEARALRGNLEAQALRKPTAEQERQAEQQKLRAEGRIPVLVGDRKRSEMRWLLPGYGEAFCDVEGGPEMVVVPAGKFKMGSPEGEQGRSSDEGPHEVTFAHPFAVGRYAVTRGQFAAFVDGTGRKIRRWFKPGFSQDDNHPVVYISWYDAKAYAAWISEITGWPYRLPAEAEWEYAARAGTDTPFWWGSSITPAQANYDGNHVYAGGGSKGEYRNGTVPAGSFQANPWGLYNVHGNVWEWCEDTWHGTYDGAPTDGSAWILGNKENSRVVRGGSWSGNPKNLRAAKRSRGTDGLSISGFRLARTLTS
jgi:formylglycine-generating enzyme required for sulfatase activity